MLKRSHAVPAAPTVPIRGTDSADPSCTDNIAPTARIHGGIRLLAGVVSGMGASPGRGADGGLEHRQGEAGRRGGRVAVGVGHVAGERKASPVCRLIFSVATSIRTAPWRTCSSSCVPAT